MVIRMKTSTAMGLILAIGVASQSWTSAQAQTVSTAPVS